MSSFRTLVAAAVIGLVPVAAQADASRAWSAAKANLPASTSVLLGINVTSITKSSAFATLFPLAMSRVPEVLQGLDKIKSVCHIDPMTAVQGIVVGTDADQKHGAVYVAVAGVDQAKLTACLELAAKGRSPDAKISVAKTGAITEIAIDKDLAYVGWIGRDVLVIPLEIGDKAQLQTWMSGKGALAKSAAGKTAAKVNTGAAAWGASIVPKTLEDGVDMKRGYGALTVASGVLAVDLHVVVASAANATAIADKASKELAGLARGNQMAADLQALIAGVTVAAKADEVIVKASVPEKQLLALLATLLRP